jgi:regulator of protease activity HflC (stomatin/prohibitin superfamily)
MKGDHLSFAKATRVALMGLGIQVALGLVLLIYSLRGIGSDHAAFSGALAILSASVVWLVLAIVFDQHRRERIEALENETLDAVAARETSVFATSADDLRVAAKRLRTVHTVLVPVASLVIGLALIGIGYVRYASLTTRVPVQGKPDQIISLLSHDGFTTPPERGWAISIAVGLAVIGFIFARFVSGMGQQKVWSPLRAGGTQMIMVSLIGVMLAVGHFALIFKADAVQRYLQLIIPVFVAVLGVEMVLNFLLNLYRPRKVGEVPRPAFESWLLGFLAAPDALAKSIGGAITYQFGVDVTGSWLYQLLSRSLATLVAFAILIVWLMSCFTIVDTGERGLRLRNGQLIEEVGPGLHFKYPWPIETIDVPKVARAGFEQGSTVEVPVTQALELSLVTPRPANATNAILWTNDHGKPEDEKKIIVQPAALGVRVESNGVTGRDLALVSVEVPVQYRVRDLKAYEVFAAPGAGDDLLTAIARREVVTYLSSVTEDDLLGHKRAEIGQELTKRIAQAFANAKSGVEVLFVGIEGVHPPKDTAEAFEKVVGNEQLRQELLEKARKEEIETLTEAVGTVTLARQIASEIDALNLLRSGGGDAAAQTAQELKIDNLILQAGGKAGVKLAEARAKRWETHMRRRGEAAAYNGRLAAYRANPTLYKANLYFQTLTDIMKDSRLYLFNDSIPPTLVYDFKDIGTGSNVFDSSSMPK